MTNAIENTAALVAAVATRGGRAMTFSNDAKLLANLIALRDNTEDAPSRNLSHQLVEMGLVEIQEEKLVGGKAGRPKHNFVLTDEGFTRIALLARSEARAAVADAETALAEAEAASEAAAEAAKAAKAAVTQAKADLKAASKASDKIHAEPMPEPRPVVTPEPEAVAEVAPVSEGNAEAQEIGAALDAMEAEAEETATEMAEA